MAVEAPATRRCPQCCATNARYAAFCIECGEPLDELPALVAAPGLPRRPTLPPVGGQGVRWELIIGALVLVVVLGFAVFDWRQGESQTVAYRNGVRAAAVRDWDTAQAAFATLGDYRDAARQRENAAANISVRDKNYALALAAISQGDWAAALPGLARVYTIQPDFKRTRSLYAQALSAAATTILPHIVMRRTGDAAGLYVTDSAAAQRRLPFSDRLSMPRIGPFDGQMLYDGKPARDLSGTPLNLPTGRVLWRGDGTLPSVNSAGSSLGLWSFELGAVPAGLGGVLGLPLHTLSYEGLRWGNIQEAPLPRGGYMLLDYSGDGRLLLGRYEEMGTAQAHTHLFVIAVGDTNLRELGQVGGIVQAARLDVAHGYALYTASSPGDGSLPHLVLGRARLPDNNAAPRTRALTPIREESLDGVAGATGWFYPQLAAGPNGDDSALPVLWSPPFGGAAARIPAWGSLPLVFAGGVIAYVTPQDELRLRTADGAADIAVQDGVDAIWRLDTPPITAAQR